MVPRALEPLTHRPSRRGHRHTHARALGSLLAVDEAVARIIGELRSAGELDETYLFFTSDNGYLQGEHRVRLGKMLPYDPSTQVPLLVRGPGLPRNRRTKALVGNIALAPSILQAARARPPRRLDGRSVLPFARDVRLRSLRPLLHETVGNGARGRSNTRRGRCEAATAARAGLAGGAHDPLAVRGLQGRPA